jgi:hypothetical protein
VKSYKGSGSIAGYIPDLGGEVIGTACRGVCLKVSHFDGVDFIQMARVKIAAGMARLPHDKQEPAYPSRRDCESSVILPNPHQVRVRYGH